MLEKLKKLLSSFGGDAQLRHKLDDIRQKTPIPVFWLYGKSQSGKTSLIKFLTGADEAEIGHGFKPCTRFSRKYLFPTAQREESCETSTYTTSIFVGSFSAII